MRGWVGDVRACNLRDSSGCELLLFAGLRAKMWPKASAVKYALGAPHILAKLHITV
jgi:hypothetical protein